MAILIARGFIPPVHALSLSVTDHREDASNSSTITYNAGGDPLIGSPDPHRYVVVAWGGTVSAGAAVTSVTIGGVSAFLLPGTNQSDNGNAVRTEFWQALVPTGTTATITMAFNQTIAQSSIAVCRIVTYATTASTATQNSSGAGSLVNNVLVPAGGGMLSFTFLQTDGGGGVGWTNATIDYEAAAGTSRASAAHTVLTGNQVVTSTYTLAGNAHIMTSAAWTP